MKNYIYKVIDEIKVSLESSLTLLISKSMWYSFVHTKMTTRPFDWVKWILD